MGPSESEDLLPSEPEHYQFAVEAAPNAMIMSDEPGRIVIVNSQAERLFGYSRDELIGQTIELLVPARFRGLHSVERQAFVAGSQTRAMGAGRDLCGVRKDGTEVPIEIGLSAFSAAGRKFVLSSIIDITERKRAESEREELLAREQAALAEARAASQAKDEFLAVLSHELRTPLHAILGWACLLRDSELATAEFERAVETIERNARNEARLIDDILEVSRMIQGKFLIDLAPCDPAMIVESALNSIRPAASVKQIRLRSTIDHVGPLMLDGGRIEQVVWNLLANAVKFTPPGGCVEAYLVDAGSHIRIRVSDNGRGIKAEFLPRVFERFSQADSSTTRQHGGLGLGLAIVRHITELHGGTIHAESPGEGKGATFTVELPVAAPEVNRRLPGSGAERFLGANTALTASSLYGCRIMVVDDEADTRDLIATGLKLFGASILAVGSVGEAFEALEKFQPSVLVSDLAMPGEDGFTLIRRLRALPPAAGGQIPVLALTAYARPEDRQRVIDAGFQLHVAKPIDPAQLASLIVKVIGPPREQSLAGVDPT
jgi:PAS domain S-box-containing protein